MLKGDCDSLGTRSLPERDPRPISESAVCFDGLASANASHSETLPAVAFSDVSFFRDDSAAENDDERAFRYTLAIVKPEAARHMFKIETLMTRNGFIVKTKDVMRLTQEQAAEFYSEHSMELYFQRLVEHMSSGPIVVYVLAKEDCVREWRRLIGPANVRHAKWYFPVSLRAVYGVENTAAPVANAFHGSDSAAAAIREIRFFFPNSEIETIHLEDRLRYIQDIMMPTITEGLAELFKINPIDPLRWFANWLLTKKVQI